MKTLSKFEENKIDLKNINGGHTGRSMRQVGIHYSSSVNLTNQDLIVLAQGGSIEGVVVIPIMEMDY